MNSDTFERTHAAAEYIRTRTELRPQVGIILGSGLGDWANEIHHDTPIAYRDIPGFAASTVAGHAGRLVIGKREGLDVVAMQGRVHAYEGHGHDEVVFGLRTLWQLGVRTVIITNAAGGIAPHLRPGDLMLIRDHINFTGRNPLIGPNDERFGPRFPDMTDAYDRDLRGIALAVAAEEATELKEGVYVGVLGPSYETPAEIRAFRTLGADAVGMSTVPEVIAARHMGMRVLGISLITNAAAGMDGAKLDHDDVQHVAKQAAHTLGLLVDGILHKIQSA